MTTKARTPKPAKPASAPPSVSYVSATVRPDEIYNPMKIAGNAQALVLRAVGEVAICAHAVATACAGQPIKLYRKAKGVNPKSKRYRAVDRKRAAYLRGEKERKPGAMVLAATNGQDEFVEVLDHPILQFMRRPNPRLPGSQWTYQRHRHQLETGNAYAFLYADELGVEAVPLLPQYMTIRSTTTELVDMWRYSRNRTTFQDLDPDQVMHQMFIPSSWDPRLGASPMEWIIPHLDLDAAAIQAETARWCNGGQPALAFEFPETASDTQIEEARQKINTQIRGIRKTGGHLFLAGGVKVAPTGLPAKDMEYIEGQDLIKRIVWRAFGIPESMLEMNESNLASAVSGNPQFARLTVAPRINADADCLTYSILPLFGLDPGEFFFAADDPCIDDMGTNMTTAVAGYGGGILTLNQALTQYLDLPATSDPEGEKRKPVPPPPTFGGFGAQGEKPKSEPKTGDVIKNAWDSKAFRAQPLTKSGWHFRGHTKSTETDSGDQLPPAAQRASEALNADLAAWHTRAARLMADNPAVWRAPLETELQTILERHLTEITRAGAEEAAAVVGQEAATIAERGAADFTRQYVIRLRDSITKDFEADITDAIRQAITDGATQAEAHAEVGNIIGEQASYRAERIARTETSRAYGSGAVQAYGEAGWRKQNILAGGACPICEGVAAKFPDPVEADVIFYDVGDTVGGVTNSYAPCLAPPYHPNCRCDVAPVAPEPDAGDGGDTQP